MTIVGIVPLYRSGGIAPFSMQRQQNSMHGERMSCAGAGASVGLARLAAGGCSDVSSSSRRCFFVVSASSVATTIVVFLFVYTPAGKTLANAVAAVVTTLTTVVATAEATANPAVAVVRRGEAGDEACVFLLTMFSLTVLVVVILCGVEACVDLLFMPAKFMLVAFWNVFINEFAIDLLRPSNLACTI